MIIVRTEEICITFFVCLKYVDRMNPIEEHVAQIKMLEVIMYVRAIMEVAFLLLSHSNLLCTAMKRALVIGVSDYLKLEQLRFCQHDGNSMYQVLRSVGYAIPHTNKLVGNISWERMRKAIIDFFDDPAISLDDTLIFYYSGHGVPDIQGDVYLGTSEIDPASPYRGGFALSELTKVVQMTLASKVILEPIPKLSFYR